MNNDKCPDCNESMRGHKIPFSNEKRPCDLAAIYAKCPDSLFCRKPDDCSVTGKCYAQEKYGRSCND